MVGGTTRQKTEIRKSLMECLLEDEHLAQIRGMEDKVFHEGTKWDFGKSCKDVDHMGSRGIDED